MPATTSACTEQCDRRDLNHTELHSGARRRKLGILVRNTGASDFVGFLNTQQTVPFFQMSETVIALRAGEYREYFLQFTGVPLDKDGSYSGVVSVVSADPRDTTAYPQATADLRITVQKATDSIPATTPPVILKSGQPVQEVVFEVVSQGKAPADIPMDLKNSGTTPCGQGRESSEAANRVRIPVLTLYFPSIMEFVDRERWLTYPAQTAEQRLFLARLEQAGKPRSSSLLFRKASGETFERDVRFSVAVEPEFLGEANVGVRMECAEGVSGDTPADDDPWKPLDDYLTECEVRARDSAFEAGTAAGD